MEWITDTCNSLDEFQKHYCQWKKPVSKDYILYDSIYMTLANYQGLRGDSRGFGVWQHERVLGGQWNCLVSWLWLWVHGCTYKLKCTQPYTLIFLGSKINVDSDSHEIKRCLLLERKAKTNLDSVLKSRDIPLPKKVHIVKAMVFPVVMYGCERDHKEGWAPKNWCFQTVVLETMQSPLDSKEIKPGNPKGNQQWIVIRRTDAEAPILWPPDSKSQLIVKDPDARKNWQQEEKGTTEDEMVWWHH